jgi:hypothetical protein
MKTDVNLWSYLAQFFLELEIFQTNVVQEIKIQVLCSKTFFRKSCRFLYTVEEYCTAGQAMGNNMTNAHCMLETQVYKHSHNI